MFDAPTHADRDHSMENRMAWAPCHSVILPSGVTFSMPSTMVRKWFPASWPTLLAKQTEP